MNPTAFFFLALASTGYAFVPTSLKTTPVRRPLFMADFELDPEKTAIVLIEYQNEFTSEGGKLHGAVQECMEKTNMLENSANLVEAARNAGCSIIHVPISFEKVC